MDGVMFGIIGAFIAIIFVFVALFLVMANMKKQRNSPVMTQKAKLQRVRSQTELKNKNLSSSTVDGANAYEVTSYFLDFLIEKKEKKTFKVKKKVALSYNDLDEGELTYKGYKFIDFIVSKKHVLPTPSFLTDKGDKLFTLKGQIDQKNDDLSNINALVSKEDILAFMKLISPLKGNDFFSIEKPNGHYLQIEANKDHLALTLHKASIQSERSINPTDLTQEVISFLNF